MNDEVKSYLERIVERETNGFDEDVKQLTLTKGHSLTVGYEREYAVLTLRKIIKRISVIESLSEELEKKMENDGN